MDKNQYVVYTRALIPDIILDLKINNQINTKQISEFFHSLSEYYQGELRGTILKSEKEITAFVNIPAFSQLRLKDVHELVISKWLDITKLEASTTSIVDISYQLEIVTDDYDTKTFIDIKDYFDKEEVEIKEVDDSSLRKLFLVNTDSDDEKSKLIAQMHKSSTLIHFSVPKSMVKSKWQGMISRVLLIAAGHSELNVINKEIPTKSIKEFDQGAMIFARQTLIDTEIFMFMNPTTFKSLNKVSRAFFNSNYLGANVTVSKLTDNNDIKKGIEEFVLKTPSGKFQDSVIRLKDCLDTYFKHTSVDWHPPSRSDEEKYLRAWDRSK